MLLEVKNPSWLTGRMIWQHRALTDGEEPVFCGEAIAQISCNNSPAYYFVIVPECALHSRKNLAPDHHSAVDACQKILNELNKSLQDTPGHPQIHDELTGHNRCDNSELVTYKIAMYLRIRAKALLCTVQQSVKDKQLKFLFIYKVGQLA